MRRSNIRIIWMLRRLVERMTWRVLLAIYLAHMVISFLLLNLAGEEVTDNLIRFIYFHTVTVSTVGYGDWSASSPMGQLALSLIIIPTGLLLFGATLTRIGESYMNIKHKMITGDISLQGLDDHILIIGWRPGKTRRIIDLVKREDSVKRPIALVTNQQELEHPLPNQGIDFVKVESFINNDELDRLNLEHARSIIVNTGDEGNNYLICVALVTRLNTLKGKGFEMPHIVVYASTEDIQVLLEQVSDNIEVINVFQEHLLSRSALFAGSSACTESLLDPHASASQYSLTLSADFEATTFKELLNKFKAEKNVLVIGYSLPDDPLGRKLRLNPENSDIVGACFHIHYIANNQLHNI